MKGREDEYLMGMLKGVIDMDRDLTNLKTSLSLRNDFNLHDIFRLMDVNKNESITKYEFESGLNKMGIFPTPNEIYLFFKRYDEDRDGMLTFGEFSKAFYTPNTS